MAIERFKNCVGNPAAVEAAKVWRDAAIADGWGHAPTYKGEEEDRACKLTREGYQIQVISRTEIKEGNLPHPHDAMLAGWGPDSLGIALPPTYPGFEWFKTTTRRCNNCGAEDVDTFRYSFAGRACGMCLPELRKKHGYPEWEN